MQAEENELKAVPCKRTGDEPRMAPVTTSTVIVEDAMAMSAAGTQTVVSKRTY